jgi:hypothetical protein
MATEGLPKVSKASGSAGWRISLANEMLDDIGRLEHRIDAIAGDTRASPVALNGCPSGVACKRTVDPRRKPFPT